MVPRYLLTQLVLAVCIFSPIIALSLGESRGASKEKNGSYKVNENVGVFESLTTSDYWYVNIKVKDKIETLYCLKYFCDEIERYESRYKNRPVRYTWKRRPFYIKELKETKIVDEILSIHEISK